MFHNINRREFISLSSLAALQALGANASASQVARLTDIFPATPQCKNLVVADIKSSDVDERITFLTLQGLINKKQPQVYLLSNEHCEFWVDYYQQRFDIQHTRTDSVYTLLEMFRDKISGYRIYDPDNLYTINLASVMASLDYALPIHPQHEAKMKQAGLRCIDDLQGKFKDRYDAYRWSIDNLYSLCSQRVIANFCMDRPHWPSHVITALDFFVSRDAFQVDLSSSRAHPKDMSLLGEIYERMEKPGCVVGWHCARDLEHEAVSLAADHGIFVICNLSSPNYSIHQSVKPAEPSTLSQALPPAKQAASTKVESKVYIAPLITDGDAAWAMTNRMDDKWTNSERGKAPMNWGFMPAVYHLGPGMLQYYIETRTDNDYLIAGPSGIGYTYPHLHPDPLPFLQMTRESMKRLDLRIANIVTWDPRLSHKGVNPTGFHNLMRREIPEALGFVRGLGDSLWEPSILDDGAPVVYSSLAIHRGDDPNERLQDLIKACPNRPLFIFAYVNHSITLAQLLETANKNSKNVEFLRLDEFMIKLKTAIKTGQVKNELYPDKSRCGALLIKEFRPKWQSALDSVLSMEPLTAASKEECLTHFAKRIGGCQQDELAAAFQFDLCQNTAKLVQIACYSRGVYIGARRQGVKRFLELYASLPDKEIFQQISKWWHEWDQGIQTIPQLQKALKRIIPVAQWLKQQNQDWRQI